MTGLRDQLATTLGRAYTLDRELGGGGMSHVFLAEDTTLGRRVVVKVLPREMASGVSIERFKREISLAARLQHPLIVPILSAGEADGLPYYTMPFVEGETLRARLTRSGQCSIAETLRVLREVASALAHAHRKGVVHRDIKPENILLTEDHAVITDFGVAKALSDAASTGLTSVGVTLGTPAYMAPEQAAADPATDHRADLYALGLVAYEMLAGQGPFAGKAPQAMIAAQVIETPEPVGHRRAAIPNALAALTMQCLAKHPADRPQRAEDVLRELEAVQVSGPSDAEAPRVPSVAVLPMVNTSGDLENEHFSDGLTDELIGVFSKVSGIAVTGRTSSFALKGKNLGVRAIADLLHVEHVLEGSVRRAGDRLKVRVQLVNADERVLWSESYDRRLEDVFAVQEEIAQAVVRALEMKLGAGRELVRPATTDLEAYDLYLKGRHLCRRWSPEDMHGAIGYLEQAVARDPSFARAHAWLSNAHWLLVVMRWDTQLNEHARRARRAREHADRALALDPLLAEAHWAMAQLLFAADWNAAAAEIAFQRAMLLDPGFEEAHHLYGLCILHQGRLSESATALTRTIKIDPLLVGARVTLARLHLTAQEPDKAIACINEAMPLFPGVSQFHWHLGQAYLQKHMPREAITQLEIAAERGRAPEKAQLAYGYGIVGRRDEAMAVIASLLESDERAPAVFMAAAYVGLSDHDEAFRWLERAVEERDPWVTTLTIDPQLDPLRADPRFAALVRRIGWAS
jgi:serine/threonine-protein kinase